MKGIAIAGQTAGEAAWSIFMFALSVVVTAAFGYLLVTDPGRLTEVWTWTRSLPLLVQLLLWLLFLPWMIALWIWTLPLGDAHPPRARHRRARVDDLAALPVEGVIDDGCDGVALGPRRSDC